MTAISLGQQRKVSLGNSPPSSQNGNAFLSSGGRLPLCPWESLHSLGFYMFSYRRQQSSFSISGVPKVQGPGLRTTASPSSGDRQEGQHHCHARSSSLLCRGCRDRRTGPRTTRRRFLLQSSCQLVHEERACIQEALQHPLHPAPATRKIKGNWEH